MKVSVFLRTTIGWPNEVPDTQTQRKLRKKLHKIVKGCRTTCKKPSTGPSEKSSLSLSRSIHSPCSLVGQTERESVQNGETGRVGIFFSAAGAPNEERFPLVIVWTQRRRFQVRKKKRFQVWCWNWCEIGSERDATLTCLLFLRVFGVEIFFVRLQTHSMLILSTFPSLIHPRWNLTGYAHSSEMTHVNQSGEGAERVTHCVMSRVLLASGSRLFSIFSIEFRIDAHSGEYDVCGEKDGKKMWAGRGEIGKDQRSTNYSKMVERYVVAMNVATNHTPA